MASSGASEVIADGHEVVEDWSFHLHLGSVFEVVVGHVWVANEGTHVQTFHGEVYQSAWRHKYVPIFSEKYSLRLNLLRQKMSILGAL
jgi:hypothetical protein